MLSAARNAKNRILAEKFYKRIESKFADDETCLVSARVLLANTYALTGNKSMAAHIRSQEKIRKTIGYAWTVVNGQIHVCTM